MRTTLEVVRYYAAHTPAKIALQWADCKQTYRDLLHTANAISRSIEQHRIRVLALAVDNGADWVAADLAAQIAAVTLVPLPAFFSAEQVRHAVADSGADGLIVDARFSRHRAETASGIKTLADLGDDLRLLRTSRVGSAVRLPAGTAKISYTSSTTGHPKGVCLSQSAMDSVAQSLWSATAQLELTRHLCLLPLATLLENIAGVYAPLRNGAEIAVPSLREIGFEGSTGIDMQRFLACISNYEPNSIILLPQTLLALVTALEKGAPRPKSLRFAAVGGARVSTALLERADRVGLPVYEGYGLTECASVVALNTPTARRIGSVGRVLPHARIRIDAHSQIHVGGATMSGYAGETQCAPHEIATGDIGHIDAEGFLHISGRRKNIFITSFGRNVSPDWVETELTRQHPIAQAALFGEARPWNVAVLVPTTEAAGSDEIQAAVDEINTELPDYARVGEWIRADERFTAANGLLTANGRNRRAAIWGRYGCRIDARYCDSISDSA
ncbi:MAG TPA: AMP-binding protein [Gammaproteobacteria bacterium]|nr:AMP-binding protein [Gammaproteobacteria bacterium]